MDFYDIEGMGGDDAGGHDDFEYKAEAGAYERVSAGGKLAELLSGVNILNKERQRKDMTPEDRILQAIDAIARKISDENIYKISETDINNILEKTQTIAGLQYKNPLAFILGYIATKNGTELSVRNFEIANKALAEIKKYKFEEEGVEPEDIVRYGRLWTV